MGTAIRLALLGTGHPQWARPSSPALPGDLLCGAQPQCTMRRSDRAARLPLRVQCEGSPTHITATVAHCYDMRPCPHPAAGRLEGALRRTEAAREALKASGEPRALRQGTQAFSRL